MAWAVLVVDDHSMVGEFMAAALQDWNQIKSVSCSTSAEDALHRVRQHPPDIAFIDARMPGMSGFELIKNLKSKYTRTRLVGMTSFEEDETLAEMLQAGMHGLLLKRSTSRQEIRLCLEEVMAGRNYFSAQVTQRITTSPKLLQPLRTYPVESFRFYSSFARGIRPNKLPTTCS